MSVVYVTHGRMIELFCWEQWTLPAKEGSFLHVTEDIWAKSWFPFTQCCTLKGFGITCCTVTVWDVGCDVGEDCGGAGSALSLWLDAF